MDARHFDALAKVLSAPESRIRLLALLAALPVLGGLLGLLDPQDAAAKDRRRRRKQRHKRRKNPGNRKRKGKRKKRCTAESVAQTCSGQCGSVLNNCRESVNCGSCACEPACGACFVCQDQGSNIPGACVVDPAQQGDACGEPGQICLTDGACACDAGSCTPPQTCGGGGVDGSCGCTPTTCAAEGATCGTIADDCGGQLNCGTCTPPDTCGGGGVSNTCGCTPTNTCISIGECGTFDNGCGDELQCPCPSGTSCYDGTCLACPPGLEELSNGTCARPCTTANDCDPGGLTCGCFITPGLCGTVSSGVPCPNGDDDCETGQFCNGYNNTCAYTCDE